ncbi:NAD-dependent epimerase/dehydratase family protein [Candidatus Cardinium hertigii]|jgi:nucleoside-diphosphate-sugar epimerase|uniref:NAD(P)-dependent oxidoreductase n=1 Tax=Candidatus Cardinium hertigii TaxID=247481 RepID=A0A3N2QBA6_9BACT|nr:NAD-dependent epimerase/dehydratase family protein [Candidatus Cardinium hertigii]ROT47103.1 NAD(P)-dependent oxidoreductase [Candidatus Cardinium hertigii]ROT47422.1 NAD(P)-dependent oxidoreductase [Candidatus Cardinium hertigii]
MKILITGGAGFVGTNLIKELKNELINLAVVDNFSTKKLR